MHWYTAWASPAANQHVLMLEPVPSMLRSTRVPRVLPMPSELSPSVHVCASVRLRNARSFSPSPSPTHLPSRCKRSEPKPSRGGRERPSNAHHFSRSTPLTLSLNPHELTARLWPSTVNLHMQTCWACVSDAHSGGMVGIAREKQHDGRGGVALMRPRDVLLCVGGVRVGVTRS